MDDQLFRMLIDRFDRVDQDNKELKDLIAHHAVQDEHYYKKTLRHEGFFRLIWASLSTIGVMLAALWSAASSQIIDKMFR